MLLQLSTDQGFILAKEYIVQGIAVKLGGAAQFDSDQLKINAKPRNVIELNPDLVAATMHCEESGEIMNA